MKNLSAKCIVVTIGLLMSTYASALQDSPVQYSVDRSYYVWATPDGKFAIPQPYEVGIAGNASGQMQLGFTHSGYTAKGSPRRADLLVSIELSSHWLNEKELNEIRKSGIKPLKAEMKINRVVLDVSLKANIAEEERVRSALKLPRDIRMGTLEALAIHWENVPGETLYEWLTGEDGLRFTVRPFISASMPVKINWSLDPVKLAKWWGTRAGEGSVAYQWEGGSTPLAFDLFANEVFVGSSGSENFGYPLNLTPSAFELAALSQAIERRKGISPEGLNTINLADLSKSGEDIPSRSGTFLYEFMPRVTNQPGKVLDATKEYVIDASGKGVGLQAIRADHR